MLTLVFVQTLYLCIKYTVGIQDETALFLDELGETLLVFLLDLAQLFQNSLVISENVQLFQLAAVLQETVADLVTQQLGQTRVGLIQPSPVCDTVGDVLELVRGVQIFFVEYAVLDDLRVQLGNAVDAVRCHNAQGSHVDLVVLDNGHPCGSCAVAAVALHQTCAVAVVDLHDDLEDSRHDLFYQVYIPLFQCLSHYGVVGISEGVGDDVPCTIPGIAAVVQQDTHQFRNCQSRVGVVDVDGNLFVQVFQCAVYVHVVVYDITDGCGAQEILLAQTQGLALQVVVVRVQHLGDRICHGVPGQCLFIVALVEFLHVKAGCLCLPQTQGRNAGAAIAGDIHIIRDGDNSVVVDMGDVVVRILPVFLDIALEVYFDRLVRLRIQPDAAARQPVVRFLGLPAVLQDLLEDTVLIADGVTGCRDLLGCHSVQIAGSQTAQTAVAQTCVRLALKDVVQVDVIVLQDGTNIVCQLQVVQGGL